MYDIAQFKEGEIEKFDCTRLLLYWPGKGNQPVSKELVGLVDRTEVQYELVEKIFDIGRDHNGIFLQTQWLGLQNLIDYA